MPPYNDSQSQSSAGSAPVVFRRVGALLAQPGRWGEWLAEHRDPAEARLFMDAFSCVVRLASQTGFAYDRVLAQIGCGVETEEDLAELPADELAACLDYMRWNEKLISDLDLAVDKRLVLSGAARFFLACDRDLDRCRAAMDDGAFSANKYLWLGEVAEAWQAAFRALEGDRGEHARATYEDNPFVTGRTPHLTPGRVDMFDREDADELLGSRVRERIQEHLDSCEYCGRAYRRREKALARQTAELPLAL